MKLPSANVRNNRSGSPLIWPPMMNEALNGLALLSRYLPSRRSISRTASETTTTTSNIVRAFQTLVTPVSCASPRCFSTLMTACVPARFPELSKTITRSPGRSNTVILQKVAKLSTPACVRESDASTTPSFRRTPTQYVTLISARDALHVDRYLRSVARPSAEDDPLDRRHIRVLPPPRRRDVPLQHHLIIGRIEVHPPCVRVPHREPRVRRIGTHHPLLSRRRYRLDVPRHVARRDPHRARACDREVREVLTDPPPLLEHLRERRGNRRHPRLVGEIAMDAPREVTHR